MEFDNKIVLLQKFLKGSINDRELKALFVWLNSEKGQMEYQNLFQKKVESNDFEQTENIDSSVLFSKIQARMHKKKLQQRKTLVVGIRNAAAIFLIGLFIPTLYFTLFAPSNEKSTTILVTESLSNEKIRKINLPDGTTAWLMSGTSITYPSDFSGMKTRNVEVTGEAFFNVAKDSIHPFILNLGELGLKVVGTSFNVSNYKDEDLINVVLKTGKVELFKGKYSSDSQFVPLKPGELGSLQKGKSELSVKNVEVAKYTSWIDGSLQFKNDPLSEVLKKLGRWYNIKIDIKATGVAEYPFSATIKNENLDQIIGLLEYSTPFRYTKNQKDDILQLIIEKK